MAGSPRLIRMGVRDERTPRQLVDWGTPPSRCIFFSATPASAHLGTRGLRHMYRMHVMRRGIEAEAWHDYKTACICLPSLHKSYGAADHNGPRRPNQSILRIKLFWLSRDPSPANVARAIQRAASRWRPPCPRSFCRRSAHPRPPCCSRVQRCTSGAATMSMAEPRLPSAC